MKPTKGSEKGDKHDEYDLDKPHEPLEGNKHDVNDLVEPHKGSEEGDKHDKT